MKYEFVDKLLQRRKEILGNVHALDDTARTFDDPGAEFESQAQSEAGYQNLRQLDDRARQEIQLVDRALDKLAKGGFGRCESCGKPIDSRRLGAIPWTTQCIQCARSQPEERETTVQEEDRTVAYSQKITPSDFTDEELEDFVYDKIHEDARIETTDLEIFSEDGLIHISGTMPDETQYRMIFDILQDVLPSTSIVDNVSIHDYPDDESMFTELEAEDQINDELLWSRDEEL
jgi:RNA polymerase-binding protein DksA